MTRMGLENLSNTSRPRSRGTAVPYFVADTVYLGTYWLKLRAEVPPFLLWYFRLFYRGNPGRCIFSHHAASVSQDLVCRRLINYSILVRKSPVAGRVLDHKLTLRFRKNKVPHAYINGN
jgi:hypothetical protein